MNRRCEFYIILLVGLLFSCAPNGSENEPSPPSKIVDIKGEYSLKSMMSSKAKEGNCEIEGSILDKRTGQPIFSEIVGFLQPPILEIEPNSAGEFIVFLPQGEYSVEFYSTNYLSLPINKLNCQSGKKIMLNIQMGTLIES